MYDEECQPNNETQTSDDKVSDPKEGILSTQEWGRAQDDLFWSLEPWHWVVLGREKEHVL